MVGVYHLPADRDGGGTPWIATALRGTVWIGDQLGSAGCVGRRAAPPAESQPGCQRRRLTGATGSESRTEIELSWCRWHDRKKWVERNVLKGILWNVLIHGGIAGARAVWQSRSPCLAGGLQLQWMRVYRTTKASTF